MKTIISPTKPGPGWVYITPEIEKMVDDYHAFHVERMEIIRNGLKELTEEIVHRRSLGEDI